MDTELFSIDYLVPLIPDGPALPTWDRDAPAPLVTAVLRQEHLGPVHDIGTPDGHLALLAKVVVPAQPATAWAATDDCVPLIRGNAAVNQADIEVADVRDLPQGTGPSPSDQACLVIIRTPEQLSLALAFGPPHAVLILSGSGGDSTQVPVPSGYRELGLDGSGSADGPAASQLLVREDELDATLEALAAGERAFAQRSLTGSAPSVWANRSVESALRIVELQRRQQARHAAQMQRQVDRALDQMSAAREECEVMRRSRSWRITRFLRELNWP